MATADEVLAEVREVGPVTAGQVAAGIGISESSARRLLRRLEEDGQVVSDTYQLRARVYLAAGEED